MSISLIMITKNEEKNIRACLESVQGLADEIIIADGYSTDKTVEIAKEYGAKVILREFDSFTLQKGAALETATKDWVLNLDADEALTPELKQEIAATIKDTKYNAFYVPFQIYFLGRKMKHSGLKRLNVLRMARRAGAKYVGGMVHEVLSYEGEAGYFKNIASHVPYNSVDQYFYKFNTYTTLGAQTMHKKGKKFNPLQILRPPFEFIRIYFLRLGILDAFPGFLWAAYSSFYPFVKYTKLWDLNRKK